MEIRFLSVWKKRKKEGEVYLRHTFLLAYTECGKHLAWLVQSEVFS
jgi:hypothetical protein